MPINRENEASELHLLTDTAARRQQELEQYREVPDLNGTDEGIESDCPILAEFYLGGSEAIARMTHFLNG